MELNVLTSKAELEAEKAENLRAFSGIKLLHIKKQLTAILAHIGRDGIFDEYTKHDISHIDYMLESLEWVIPKETQELLTPADWLMIVLSIYFHDLGMLVTKEEYNNRKHTEFDTFKKEIIKGEYGIDFRNKILGLDTEDRQDRFIYQELVRKTHAERVKYWIIDEPNSNFKTANAITKEIKALINNIDPMFRRDLAYICESHHLSDLDNFDKYKTSRPYGSSNKETVNLHYAALILRTADLLHITSDRTPTIEYILINPTDPISQEEWAKQKSVKAIRPQIKKNKDGALDDDIPKDSLEVIALFEEDNGFFGLMSYLKYASNELNKNYQFNELAKKHYASKYNFPWKEIDDTNVEAKDFERKQFEFTLDQTKILDLLVGHTLYNDPTVVLRELTQNSIDAAKLKKYELKESSIDFEPEIHIKWEDEGRCLSFMDNGTGMTLEIIQNHLLKVGSSRYQDENFKKRYPDFSPISRFGIGLLTCFLIADDIDIITKSSDAEKAILLRIKKVHGKYLLKYLDAGKPNNLMAAHGTTIKLYVRSDVDLSDLENDLEKWIVIPNCKISLIIGDNIKNVGYVSPKEAITKYLKTAGYEVNETQIKVGEIEKNGVTIAFALRYLEHFKEWVFITHDFSTLNQIENTVIGTCVEGIRVDFNSPGYTGLGLIALANTTGKNAPKTNVARSNIEVTSESENLLVTIYEVYLQHVSNQVQNLLGNEFSVSWAAREASWLINSFVRSNSEREIRIQDNKAFEKAIYNTKCILLEKGGKRDIISASELKTLGHYWTIDSASYESADSLIREVKGSNSSSLSLMDTIFSSQESTIKHVDNLFCSNRSSVIERYITHKHQVDTMIVIPEQRRLDLRWSVPRDPSWKAIKIGSNTRSHKAYVQLQDIELDNSMIYTAINSRAGLFFLKKSDINTYLLKLLDDLNMSSPEDEMVFSQVAGLMENLFNYKDLDKSNVEELVDGRFERNDHRRSETIIWNKISRQELISVIVKSDFIRYDTTLWDRRVDY